MFTMTHRLPRHAVLPDYGVNGLYGLASGLRRWLRDRAAGWPYGDVAEGEAATVVLLVVDGLGDRFLGAHGAGSALLSQRQGRLSSVFPSTTASAVTTLLTGVSPSRHGLNGWFIRDRRFGGVIAPLPLLRRAGGSVEAFRLIPRLFPQDSMFCAAKRPVVVLSPQDIAFSRYSRHHNRGARIRPYKGLDALGAAIVEEALAMGRGGGLVHAYYPVFDALSHAFGSHSAEARQCFARIDAMFAALCECLAGSGVRLVVTADHGFIDAPPERCVRLPVGGAVAGMLAAPLFGERRLAFCAVRRGAEAEFEAWAAEGLVGRAVVMSADELLDSGLLGPDPAHRRLRERVGSHVLLMEPGCTIIDEVEGEEPHAMIGVHGGLSADEMMVPLICVRT